MIALSKHKYGDTFSGHCCDACSRVAGIKPTYPPDSGSASWLCNVCGHYGIGSEAKLKICDWLVVRPIRNEEGD